MVKSCIQQSYIFLKFHFYTVKLNFMFETILSYELFAVFFQVKCRCFLVLFISYFIFNHISSCFSSFLNNSFRSSFCCSIHYFLPYLSQNFLVNEKVISFNIFSVFWFCWISHFYNVYPIISVKLTLSSISSALLKWSVNQTSTKENSIAIVFIIVKERGEIFINCANCLFGTKVNKIFTCVGNHFWINYNELKQLRQILILKCFHRLYLCQHLVLCFLIISLFQDLAILICGLFLCWKQFYFGFYLDKFELADFQFKVRFFGW